MSSLSHLLTCCRVIKDQNNYGLFTYLDVFDHFIIPKNNNSITKQICIVGKINTSGGSIKIEIRFIFPNGTESDTTIIEGNIQPGYLQVAAAFPPIVFTQTGKHYLKIRCQGTELENDNKFYFEVRKET